MTPHAHRPDGRAQAPVSRGLADYVLGAELHSSGLATLQLAWRHTELPHGRAHVVRRLRPEHLIDPELRSLVAREVQIGRLAQSRNLVPVVAGSTGDDPFSVLEYVEGLSLEQCLTFGRDRPDFARLLVPAVVDALAGLSALHELDGAVTHQAPTPRHILIGLDGVARLTDYTQCVGGAIPWTAPTVYRLRPEEMAPEQALAPEHVDPRCDVFIAATTLWHVLTGSPLFGDELPEQALQKMLRMPIPSLADAGVRAGPRLDRLVWQALVRTRRERLASSAEFAESVRLYAEQAGLYATRDELSAYVRDLWDKQAVEEPVPAVTSAAPSPAVKLAAARPTLVGLAPLPADIRAQLQSAINPIAESPAAQVKTPPLAPAPAPEPPAPTLPAPPLDSRASLPRVARELDRVGLARRPVSFTPEATQLPAPPLDGSGQHTYEPPASPGDEHDTEEHPVMPGQQAVQALPSSPAPAYREFQPSYGPASRHPRRAARARTPAETQPLAPAYGDFELTQEPAFQDRHVGAAHAPSDIYQDTEHDYELPRRSSARVWAVLAAVVVLGAAAYGFRTFMTREAPIAVTPARTPAPAALEPAPPAPEQVLPPLVAPGATAPGAATSAEPVAPPSAPVPPPVVPSAPALDTSVKSAAPTRAEAPAAKPARRRAPKAAKSPEVRPEGEESAAPSRARTGRSSTTSRDQALPFNPYD